MSKFKVFTSYLILIFIYIVTFVLRLFQFTDSYDMDKVGKRIFPIISTCCCFLLIITRIINSYFSFLLLGYCCIVEFIMIALFGISIFAAYYDSVNEEYCTRVYNELETICKNKKYKLISKRFCDLTRFFTLKFYYYAIYFVTPFWLIYGIYKMTEKISDTQAIFYLFACIWAIALCFFWRKRYKFYERMRVDPAYSRNRDSVKFKQNRKEAKTEEYYFNREKYDDFRYYNAFKESDATGNKQQNSNHSYRNTSNNSSGEKAHRAASVSKYFCGCTNSAELKKRYHDLAKTMHPDVGGDEDDFQEMTAEYDIIEEKWRNLGI